VSHFFERFPKYILTSHEWQVKPWNGIPWKKTDLTDVDLLYVFGLGDGSFYRHHKEWLHEKPTRRLVFFEEDPGIIAALLEEGTTIFDDPQVDFELLENETLDRFAWKYPLSKSKVLMTPGYDAGRFRKHKLSLLRKTALSSALFTDRLHGSQLFRNFVQNVPRFQGGFYANGLKNAFRGMTAIICGAGPSLQNDISLLREVKGKALLIAGGSAIAALSSAGIEPHFGVAVDPNEEEYHRFRSSFFFEGPLLLSTRVCPALFNTCNGPFGYMRSGTGGPAEQWLDEKLGLTEPLMPEDMPEESMSVMTLALAFAEHIGCERIVLTGVDLAYTGAKRYAPGIWSEKQNGIASPQNAADQLVRRKGKNGHYLQTAIRWVMEAASIAEFAKKRPHIHWVNATEGGLPIAGLEELPLATIPMPPSRDIRGNIAREMALHPMPHIPKDILDSLHESVARAIYQLEVLAGERPGSKALAECDLQDEIATQVLFSGVPTLLERSEFLGVERSHWALYLEIARMFTPHQSP
jgi:hypothetical protein